MEYKRKQLYCCSPNMKTTKNIKRIVFNQASVNVYSTEKFDNEYTVKSELVGEPAGNGEVQ